MQLDMIIFLCNQLFERTVFVIYFELKAHNNFNIYAMYLKNISVINFINYKICQDSEYELDIPKISKPLKKLYSN